MTDPLLALLDSLPSATLDASRTNRIRARCHAALALGRRNEERERERGRTTRRWPPIVAGLGGLYLTEVLHQVIAMYGGL